ncbi:autophagy-related protein 23-like isoform X1 [Miscanthus floridulus]|uniref:autophagy-related protein 23-like isoform X1 n=1 Tax=Miscanthus floridulus TaxID=154761 RepID=UPI00345A04C7
MIPSSATPRRRTSQRRRPRNAASASVRGSASARALAAGLWRLRHAERMMAAGASPAHAAQTQPKLNKGRSRRRPASHLCYGNKRRADHLAAETHCRCRNGSILDKIDACVECPAAYGSSSMEKATKWDANHLHLRGRARGLQLDDIFFASPSTSPLLLLMEAELEKARGHVRELEDEQRVMTKRLERFLRKLAEEKAAWKARVRDKARHAVAALRDELGAERRHRRQLEQANARLLRDLAEARASAKQQAQSYEMERKARELMEDACSELTREVEEDQAEVELLRRECLRMREEMEEERRMLQMAEVWREERVQMKLSDAKLALENKYTHLNRLQAEMEAFLRSKDDESASHSAALREARLISDAAAATSSSVVRSRQSGENHHHHHHPVDSVDADSVLDHFRRKERERHHHAAAERERDDDGRRYSSSPASPASSKSSDMLQSVSPATDLFLAKANDDDDMYADGGSSADLEMDSCSWVGTSDRSASVANGNGAGSGVTTEARSSGASRRSTKNTALIRRLWRSAITESRKKTGRTAADGGGWSPSYSAHRRRSCVTAEGPPPPPPPAVAGEQCSSSSGSGLPLPPQRGGGGKQKQSLKEKLMEARMDEHNPLHAHAVKMPHGLLPQL